MSARGRAPPRTRAVETMAMTLEQAATYAAELAARPEAQSELAALRAEWDDEVEAAARHADYRVRGVAFRALAQFRFRQKLELLRRGLDDESPGVRGSALIALESLSRDHPGDVNSFRPLINKLATRDPNVAVRRLAIACFKNGTPDPATIRILDGIAADDEAEPEVRKAAGAVATLLVKRQRLKKK